VVWIVPPKGTSLTRKHYIQVVRKPPPRAAKTYLTHI